jgi:Leucine-rich repeat (LRR) protein
MAENFIEEISGLEELLDLETLDLSMNQIKKI